MSYNSIIITCCIIGMAVQLLKLAADFYTIYCIGRIESLSREPEE